MNSSLSFNPVQGAESKIKLHTITDGNIYFATDTGKMFLDTSGKRISVGGAGAAIYYSKGTAIEHVEGYWIISKGDMTNLSDSPSLNDIILNIDDGAFYRVESITNTEFHCSRLAISGTGGGVATTIRPSLVVENLENVNIINGSDAGIWFTATSMTGEDGNLLAKKLTIDWKLYEGDSESGFMYYSSTLQVESGVKTYLNFGSYLRNSTTTTISLVAKGSNHDSNSAVREATITTTAMSLKMASGFSNLDPFDKDKVRFTVIAEGKIDKTLDITFDGALLDPKKYNSVGGTILAGSTQKNYDIVIPAALCTHGAHKIKVDLYQLINGERKQSTEPIEFEIAVNDGQLVPIVWLGNYNKIYYTYDSIQIPYLAYDPSSPNEAKIYLYKNYVLYEDDERSVKQRKDFYIWEISDSDNESTNRYQISCGTTKEAREASQREIEFKVLQDKRDLTVAKSSFLRLNFDPKGRSNNESKLRRNKWKYEDISANFENFNWYNNGWMMDENKRTFLRISNGAKLTFPLGKTEFAGNTQDTQSHTFELMFKIRNIQDYTDLITNVTRYKFNDKPDNDLYEEYKNSNFDNYDLFLQNKLGGDYDKLEFAYVDKLINLSNAVCRYCNGSGQNVLGWAFGPQDAFFKDGSNTVSVSYVEDELISLSLVFKYDSSGRSMILFYLNGVITGVAYTSVSSFSVDSNIVFDSSRCDIDLYKLRVYETPLDVQEVVKNYCVDRTDIDNFDLLTLAKENTQIKEYQISYEEVVAWNEAHPNNQTMPYIIYDTTKSSNNDRLSWSKQHPINATITFVNTQLDRAYAIGDLEKLAADDGLFNPEDPNLTAEMKAEAVKTYYKHHCPSWTGENCELVVQGTSSEYYPRRNYKIKTKTEFDADKVERVHIFLNKGPFEEDYKKDPELTRQKYWYMNNYTSGTHKWTMKVDFMESSGSYNAGFASMVKTAYTKHPLQDYVEAGAINTVVTEYKEDAEGNPTQEIKKQYNGLAPIVNFAKPISTNPLDNANIKWDDYRTSLLGFPVMAFHKKADGYTFIGYYRMLLDKGSDEVLGFKPPKGVTANLMGGKDVRKKAECWEFSNNNRTYCSYRDPWDRVELSFTPPDNKITDETGLTAAGIPIVADSFEYRYHDKEDYLDTLYGLGKKDNGVWGYAGKEEDAAAFLKETGIDITSTNNWPAAREKMLDYYKNWEDVCKWVWSTCIDNVISSAGIGNGYQPVKVGDTPFTTDGSLLIAQNESFVPVTSGVFDINIDYWKTVEIEKPGTEGEKEEIQVRAYVYDPEDKDEHGNPRYKYEIDKFYQEVDGVYSLSSDAFNDSVTYYILEVDEDYVNKYSNLLVSPATEYVEGTQYYTYNPNITNAEVKNGTLAVNPVTVSSAEEFAQGTYYVASPVVYSSGTFTHDTKEYRAEKFKKELSSHFDLEYMATYFIMTEVFECYDSRGKNCMMASWGPLSANGDYVWYPIFYDIDTQLGINNTGIPSFTFNIDATLNDNFSTSDSVLWNNFYSYFRSSYILQKYMHLKGIASNIYDTRLPVPPLEFIDTLEDWYLFDYDATKNLATKGLRPLIATNLDAWYKYITITNIVGSSNPALLSNGTVGYMGRNGEYQLDSGGTYFYALQGDRKQSRRSFLNKRIDYVDSWLGVGDYARSGNNCIWGRVSANDASDTSDVWLEGNPADEKYWVIDQEGKETNVKTHPFDAQYWLNLKPIYSTYVTVSDDAAAYPSIKYDGKTPVKVTSTAIESGVRRSPNYKEQLLYIYGSDKMLDIGDMSNLYWREFKIDGKASKLTRLKLGHDGVVRDYKYVNGEKVYEDAMTWKNGYLNQPSIPAGLGSSGMPLLKEANFCNITIQAGGSDPKLDLCTCEKLENFRATGSNLAQVIFADGVSLNTLYLPASITTLSLVEANLLTKVLKTYTTPIEKEDGSLETVPGLYLEGFFEGDNRGNTSLKNINISGGSLGYDSFDIFKRFYDLRHGSENNRLTMTDVEWCPYTPVVEGDSYDANLKYFIDDEHYGFADYVYVSDSSFKGAALRGELYYATYKPKTFETEESFKSDKRIKYYIDNNKYVMTPEFIEGITKYYVVIDDSAMNSDGTYKINSNIYTIIKNLITDENFKSVENANNQANLSGIIYIDNSDGAAIDEAEISGIMQKAYPNMKFFITNAVQAYSAKFVVMNDDGSYNYVPDINGDKTYDSIQKISQNEFKAGKKTFENPFNLYDASDSKSHYDFIGWCKDEIPMSDYSNIILKSEKDKWGSEYKGFKWGVITEGQYSQTYYAAFEAHHYKASFVDKDNPDYKETVLAQYDPKGNNKFHSNVKEPDPIVETPEEYRYALKGWTTTENYGGYYDIGVNINEYLTDVSTIPVIGDIVLYAVFQLESVYDKATDDKYFNFKFNNKLNGWEISLNKNYYTHITGKITLPATHVDPDTGVEKDIVLMGSFSDTNREEPLRITHIFFMPGSKYIEIGEKCFRGKLNTNHKLQMIKFPNTVTKIQDQAFYFCRNLKTVILPDSVTYIGESAFAAHSGGGVDNSILELNKLPESLKEIGSNAFYKCPYVNITSLPKSLITIGDSAFRDCFNVGVIDFGGDIDAVNGSKLKTIGKDAFRNAGTRADIGSYIILRQSINTIGEKAFEGYGSKNIIAYYTHPSGFDYSASYLGVSEVQKYEKL